MIDGQVVCDNFPAQWLQLDRLITSIPDPEKFGYFILMATEPACT